MAKTLSIGIFVVTLVLLAPAIFAVQACDGDIDLSAPANLMKGELFNLTYSDPWNNNGQIQLNIPAGLTVINGVSPANIADDGFGGGIYIWTLNATDSDTYNTTVTANYLGCAVSKIIDVAGPDPTLEIGLLPFTDDLLVKAAKEFNIILNNTGDGDAFNVGGSLISGADFNSTSINASLIGNNNEKVFSYSMTPTTCGQDTLTASISNYYNENSQLMDTITNSTNFNVVGSDLNIKTVILSNSTPAYCSSITITAEIENIGTLNATGVKVEFYKSSTNNTSNKIGSSDLGIIAIGEIKNTSQISWTVDLPAGLDNIIVVVDADNECPASNNRFSKQINVTAGSCPQPPEETTTTLSSARGGGVPTPHTAQNYPLTITTQYVTKQLYEGDSISFMFKDENHSIIVDDLNPYKNVTISIESDRKTFTLVPGDKKKIDIDNNNTDDIELEVVNIAGYWATIKLSALYEFPPAPVTTSTTTTTTSTTTTLVPVTTTLAPPSGAVISPANVVGVVIAVIVIAALIYYFYFRSEESAPSAEAGKEAVKEAIVEEPQTKTKKPRARKKKKRAIRKR